jgi:hypothetical protein
MSLQQEEDFIERVGDSKNDVWWIIEAEGKRCDHGVAVPPPPHGGSRSEAEPTATEGRVQAIRPCRKGRLSFDV